MRLPSVENGDGPDDDTALTVERATERFRTPIPEADANANEEFVEAHDEGKENLTDLTQPMNRLTVH